MRHRSHALLFTVAALSTSAFAQSNLVPNASFENYLSCPTTDDQVNRAVGWSKVGTGTSDYMNACHTSSIVGVPNNVFGSQAARTGKAYTHLITATKNASNYREYMQVQLTSPLASGLTYDVQFYVSRTDGKIAVAQIGALFSSTPLSSSNSQALNLVPQVENTTVISDTVNWVLVSGSFVAAGGEQYLTIGNFRTPANTTKTTASGLHIHGSYYIDDVSVIARKPIACHSQLIGWADLPSPATVGYLDTQDFEANCKPANTVCTTTVPVRASFPYAGGTAYNQRYRTVWVSDGDTLAEYYTDAARACRPRCAPRAPIFANRSVRVSGLAFGDRRQELYQLSTVPGYCEIATYDASGRCLGQASICRITLPAGAIAAGLAYDELRDYLYVSIDVPLTTGGYTHLLYVYQGASPCHGICKNPLQSCTTRLTTGLAYDSCSQTLYATDGQTTQSHVIVDPKQCKFAPGKCCKKQTKPVWRGLAILPCDDKKIVGKSCMSRLCPSCPSMAAGCSGDAALGRDFPITLTGAPAPSFAIFFLKFGTCGTGINLPAPFCGTWYAFPALLNFGPYPLISTSPCGGSKVLNLPIPVDPRFCGLPFCAQWFVFCQSQNTFGLGFSNAIEFKVVGS